MLIKRVGCCLCGSPPLAQIADSLYCRECLWKVNVFMRDLDSRDNPLQAIVAILLDRDLQVSVYPECKMEIDSPVTHKDGDEMISIWVGGDEPNSFRRRFIRSFGYGLRK